MMNNYREFVQVKADLTRNTVEVKLRVPNADVVTLILNSESAAALLRDLNAAIKALEL